MQGANNHGVEPTVAAIPPPYGLHWSLRKRAWRLEKRIADRRHLKLMHDIPGLPRGYPVEPSTKSSKVVDWLVRVLSEPALVKDVLEFLFEPATPAVRGFRVRKSTTWAVNMQYACEWEKDAMILLLRREWDYFKHTYPPRGILKWYGAVS